MIYIYTTQIYIRIYIYTYTYTCTHIYIHINGEYIGYTTLIIWEILLFTYIAVCFSQDAWDIRSVHVSTMIQLKDTGIQWDIQYNQEYAF